jgi:hypothetical protein
VSNRDENVPRAQSRAFTSTLALLCAALACALVLIAVPRPVPLALPALALPAAEVRAALARDRELAARAPSTPAAVAMYDLLLAAGRQELGHPAPEGPWQYRGRRVEKAALAEFGQEGVRALRARATERFMLALTGELADRAEAQGLCGAQRELFLQHGYLAASGRLMAPELSVRATYKGRWNMIFGRAADFDLSPIERLAYEGFRALEARNMPSDQRGQALAEFARAGGRRGAEALAIWSAFSGNARELVERARAGNVASSELRLRNMALGVLSARSAGGSE